MLHLFLFFALNYPFFALKLPYFCIVFPKTCISLSQSESRNFCMYINYIIINNITKWSTSYLAHAPNRGTIPAFKNGAKFCFTGLPSAQTENYDDFKLFQLCEFEGKSMRILLYLGPSSIARIILLVQKYDPHMFLIIINSVFPEGVEGGTLGLLWCGH